jgi:hypothetical protein
VNAEIFIASQRFLVHPDSYNDEMNLRANFIFAVLWCWRHASQRTLSSRGENREMYQRTQRLLSVLCDAKNEPYRIHPTNRKFTFTIHH